MTLSFQMFHIHPRTLTKTNMEYSKVPCEICEGNGIRAGEGGRIQPCTVCQGSGFRTQAIGVKMTIALINLQAEYIQLLEKSCNEMIGIAVVHHYMPKETDIDKGTLLRLKIAEAKQKLGL